MNGSAHGLTSKRAEDWRNSAACRTEDPNLFFPQSTSGEGMLAAEQAKAVCRRCPVVGPCGEWALADRIGYGIFGALTEKERAALLRSATRRQLTAEAVAAKAKQARQPRKPRTLRGIFNAHTVWLDGGHLAWNGRKQIHFRGQVYTPRQLCFTVDRGHFPDGRVTTECGVAGCVLPLHLADNAERARCGTRSGYQRHLREKTTICRPCRQANTDADNNLRRTGTTKKAAA